MESRANPKCAHAKVITHRRSDADGSRARRLLTDSDLNKGRALVAAFMFGALVGLAEIASRYRDEPLKAVDSPYGLVYLFLNGYLSMLAFLLILLLASLLAFQNLDDAQKKTLSDTYDDYQAQATLPDAIKQLALGFIFLTLVGEAHFGAVLENAKTLSSKSQSLSGSSGSLSQHGSRPNFPPPPPPPPDLVSPRSTSSPGNPSGTSPTSNPSSPAGNSPAGSDPSGSVKK